MRQPDPTKSCDLDYDRELRAVHTGENSSSALGRNFAAGKYRGYHLDFGALKPFVSQDYLYKAALAAGGDGDSKLSIIAPPS